MAMSPACFHLSGCLSGKEGTGAGLAPITAAARPAALM
jgi:hypothetical protein